MADVFADPQLAARDAIVEADGVPMQGLVARLSRTPGRCGGRAGPSAPTTRRAGPRRTTVEAEAEGPALSRARSARPADPNGRAAAR